MNRGQISGFPGRFMVRMYSLIPLFGDLVNRTSLMLDTCIHRRYHTSVVYPNRGEDHVRPVYIAS